jgi:hypothetical protein
MVDKNELRAALLALEAKELSQSEDAYTEYLSGAARDASEPVDIDQGSQRFENAEIAQSFETSIHTYSDALEKVRKIDFSPKSSVEEGAAVCIDSRWLVIAVATARFKVGKMRFMGISTAAPIYKAIKGKVAGEKFEFDGKELEIEAID